MPAGQAPYIPPIYIEDWFAVAYRNWYTVTHNLNSKNVTVEVWFAVDAAGTDATRVGELVSGSGAGAVIIDPQLNSIKVGAGYDWCGAVFNTLNVSHTSGSGIDLTAAGTKISGFYKVIVRRND